ncbi:MAG: LptF/LptG family permease [Alphaproteobacteria bacterium GM7ARS4]|nr:LptF/LptG family permease [Alphaproteobacteria bacterium GM7ARS4]
MVGSVVVLFLSPATAFSMKNFLDLENRYFRGIDGDIALSPAGLWLKETNASENVIIHARQLSRRDNTLSDVSMVFFDYDNRFLKRWDAKTALIESGDEHDGAGGYDIWSLDNVLVTKADGVSRRVEKIAYPAKTRFDKIQDNFTPPEAVSVWNLSAFSQLMEETGFSPRRHLMYFYFLVMLPFFTAGMGALSVLCALMIPLRGFGGMFIVSLATIIIGFIIFIFSEFLYGRGEAEQIPFFLAASIPVVVVVAFSSLLLSYRESYQ